MSVREQGTTILARLPRHRPDVPAGRPDRGAAPGADRGRPAPGRHAPGRRGSPASGQQVDSSARRQLTRLHGLTDGLVSADPSSSLSLILSALGAAPAASGSASTWSATGACSAPRRSVSAPASLSRGPGWPFGPGGGPVGLAAADERPVVADNVRAGAAWRSFRDPGQTVKVASSWSVPVLGPSGLSGVITVFRTRTARRSATSSTWSRCTRGTPPARSSGTGCSTR